MSEHARWVHLLSAGEWLGKPLLAEWLETKHPAVRPSLRAIVEAAWRNGARRKPR